MVEDAVISELKKRIKAQKLDKYKLQRSTTFIKHKTTAGQNLECLYDIELYPETIEADLLPWKCFCRDFESTDKPFDDMIKTIIRVNSKEMLDFRPYLIEHPIQVLTTDPLEKCSDIFRKMHLRHMLVADPANGKLVGIITRGDLFAYLDM